METTQYKESLSHVEELGRMRRTRSKDGGKSPRNTSADGITSVATAGGGGLDLTKNENKSAAVKGVEKAYYAQTSR